ncbi:hypothetical protein EFQ43_10330, partial [Limosilactobacillus fermentum]|nr:hypothetical protein [Limosilactobacillus fermentum]
RDGSFRIITRKADCKRKARGKEFPWALGVSEAETIGRRQASLTKKKNQLRMVIIYRRVMKKL